MTESIVALAIIFFLSAYMGWYHTKLREERQMFSAVSYWSFYITTMLIYFAVVYLLSWIILQNID